MAFAMFSSPGFCFLLLCQLSAWLLGPPALVRSHSVVTHLPGFKGPLPFYLETGYVVVDEAADANLFYYFVKSESNPAEDPLIVWHNGGPGCSAISGMAFGIGPFTFEIVEYDGSLPTLVYNPYSWTKVANMIFLDSPVGTGFSFSRKPEGYLVGDTKTAQQVVIFLRKWLLGHPGFLSNPLYIAGDSYGGKVVPLIASLIAEGNEEGNHPFLNLQGISLGNPTGGDERDILAYIPYAHGVGLISYELYQSILDICKGDDYLHPVNADCELLLQTFNNVTSVINKYNILSPLCDDQSKGEREVIEARRSILGHLNGFRESLDRLTIECDEYGFYLCQQWMNLEITRESLHIEKDTIEQWIRCTTLTSVYTVDVPNSIPYVYSLATKGYRVLIYSGDHDMYASFLGATTWIRSFNFSIIDEWHAWMVDNQSAGFTIKYFNNLTYATVKGGSHTAAQNRPKQCFAMISRWLSKKSL